MKKVKDDTKATIGEGKGQIRTAAENVKDAADEAKEKVKGNKSEGKQPLDKYEK